MINNTFLNEYDSIKKLNPPPDEGKIFDLAELINNSTIVNNLTNVENLNHHLNFNGHNYEKIINNSTEFQKDCLGDDLEVGSPSNDESDIFDLLNTKSDIEQIFIEPSLESINLNINDIQLPKLKVDPAKIKEIPSLDNFIAQVNELNEEMRNFHEAIEYITLNKNSINTTNPDRLVNNLLSNTVNFHELTTPELLFLISKIQIGNDLQKQSLTNATSSEIIAAAKIIDNDILKAKNLKLYIIDNNGNSIELTDEQIAKSRNLFVKFLAIKIYNPRYLLRFIQILYTQAREEIKKKKESKDPIHPQHSYLSKERDRYQTKLKFHPLVIETIQHAYKKGRQLIVNIITERCLLELRISEHRRREKQKEVDEKEHDKIVVDRKKFDEKEEGWQNLSEFHRIKQLQRVQQRRRLAGY